MKPNACNEETYPCIFIGCLDRCCYHCGGATIPFICRRHSKKVAKYYRKKKLPNYFRKDITLCNFKEWRQYEKKFRLIRWPSFIIAYRKILKRFKKIFVPKISVRYKHYYHFFLNHYQNEDESVDEEYEPYYLEEELLSDSEPDDDNDKQVLYWHPLENVRTMPFHKDRDY